jgi:hypothetical protein
VAFEQFGTAGDDARVVYDYDGDGRADPAVFRSSDDTLYFRGSSNNAAGNISFARWGTAFAIRAILTVTVRVILWISNPEFGGCSGAAI